MDIKLIQLPFFFSPQTIYRNVLDDVYEYPILEKELKEFQKILGMHRRQYVLYFPCCGQWKKAANVVEFEMSQKVHFEHFESESHLDLFSFLLTSF